MAEKDVSIGKGTKHSQVMDKHTYASSVDNMMRNDRPSEGTESSMAQDSMKQAPIKMKSLRNVKNA